MLRIPAQTPSGQRSLGASVFGLAVAFLVLGLLNVHASSSGLVISPNSGIAGLSEPMNFTTINVSNIPLASPGAQFWGVSVEGGNPDPDTPSLLGFLNASPFTELRYGATWIDEENWSSGCFYNDTSVCYSFHNNVSDYADLCLSSPRYYCILGVPAEINSVSTLAYEVNWLQSTTGWQPNCWAIGNEPEAWTHFNIPWTAWKSSDNRVPTAAQFAQVALNYTDTLRSIDGPGTCIIGLESDSPIANIGSFTNAVTSAVPNDTAVSFHSYPDGKCTLNGKVGTASLSQLLSPSNLTATQLLYNASAANDTSGVPVYIQEFNMGSAHGSTSCGPWVTSYTDSVFTSAVVAQALTYGDPQFTFFHFDCQTPDCLVNSTTGIRSPTYWLYADLLSQMDLEQLHQVNFTAGGNAHTYAVLGENGTHDRTLLLANAQPRGWLNLSVSSLVPSLPTDWEIQNISQNWGPGCASTGCVTTWASSAVSTGPAYITIRNQSTVLVHFWNSLPFSADVNFSESGLPIGTTWSVQVLGHPTMTATVSSSGGTDQTVTLDDGSYTFSATDLDSSWAPPTSFPSIFVDGTSQTQSIVFTLVTFPVEFTKTGLLTGAETDWSVTFDGVTMTGPTMSGNPLVFAPVPNGTYAYSIADVPGFHQTTLPYSSTLNVDGTALAESIAFLPVEYTATVSESGLPSGLPWSVTLNGTTMGLTSDGGTDTLTWTDLTNGTYPYTISDVPGWHQPNLAYSGSIPVNGGSGAIDGTGNGFAVVLTYIAVTYEVTLSESTLPSGQAWEITVGGVAGQLTTDGSLDSLTWTGLGNGTYSYSIASISGWHETTLAASGKLKVIGGNGPIDGTGNGYLVTLVYSRSTYPVSFSETGLPSGRTWTVTFNGVMEGLTTDGGTDTQTFTAEPNGTYGYSIQGISGYHQSTVPYTGTETIAGAGLALSLTYTQVTYALEFVESNLPSGLTWTVTVNSGAQHLTTDGGTDTLTFAAANGTIAYSVTGTAGWHQTTLPYAGSVSVSGSSETEPTLVYSAVTYKATFTEAGLASGTSWAVTVGSLELSSASAKIVFALSNGTYSFTVDPVTTHKSTPAAGSLSIAGGPVSRTVKFTDSDYTITFSESGLPLSTSWCVTLTPGPQAACSTTKKVAFSEGNGDYSYSVTPIAGNHITTGSYTGTVTVSGASPATVTIHWKPVTYAVKFTESGLAKGTTWSVTIDGKKKSTTGKSISLDLGNGTYAFTIAAAGHSETSNPTNPLTVDGAVVDVTVTFTAT
ncbi:MAG: hypothetical protein WA688_08230 [Thermoplasmata archaeon]